MRMKKGTTMREAIALDLFNGEDGELADLARLVTTMKRNAGKVAKAVASGNATELRAAEQALAKFIDEADGILRTGFGRYRHLVDEWATGLEEAEQEEKRKEKRRPK